MRNKKTQHVCIIGGGITGNAFVWFLSNKTKDSITIIEREVTTGGLAKGIGTEFGFKIDQFYHFLYNNDSENTIDFFHKLGLHPKVIWRNIKSAVFVKDTLFSIDELSSFMRVKLLLLRDKIQFLISMMRVVFINFKSLDSILSDTYLIQLFGKNNYKLIWEPLLVSKFAEYAKQIPASWIARRIQVTFFSRSWSGKTRYGYILGTYSPLFKRLESVLRKKNVKFIKDQVISIEQVDNKVVVTTQNTGTSTFDKVVVATPIEVARKLIKNSNVKEQLAKYKELNAFVTLLFLKKKFSDYFWINVNDKKIPFTGIIELTNLTGTKVFKNMHIVYLSQYLSDKSHFDKEDYITNMTSYLKKINNNFQKEDILKQFHSFASGAAPIPFINYMSSMPPFQSKQNKIFLLNSSMIYPQDRGVGNSIKLAESHIEEFIAA